MLQAQQKDNCQLTTRIMHWNVSDQVHKIFIKETFHEVQQQINIKFIQKLKPVIEAARIHDIQNVFTKVPTFLQRLPTPSH